MFLLLAATFVGLFAGTAVQLGKERHKPAVTQTYTSYVSEKHPATATVTATTTIGHGGQHPFPVPAPTGKPEDKDKVEVCLSRECVLLASEILQNIDESVDPCEDFYSYASKSHTPLTSFCLANESKYPCDQTAAGFPPTQSLPIEAATALSTHFKILIGRSSSPS